MIKHGADTTLHVSLIYKHHTALWNNFQGMTIHKTTGAKSDLLFRMRLLCRMKVNVSQYSALTVCVCGKEVLKTADRSASFLLHSR